MTQIIAIEDLKGPFQEEFQRIMKIIPEKEKECLSDKPDPEIPPPPDTA